MAKAISLSVGDTTFPLHISDKRKFKSGSKGFFANGKVIIDGKRYNVSFPIVEIGSKPK